MASDVTALTPNKVAHLYGVGMHKVLGWIATGELRAINVASTLSGRPRWVVKPEALDDFEQRRAAKPQPPTRRRPQRNSDVTEYF